MMKVKHNLNILNALAEQLAWGSLREGNWGVTKKIKLTKNFMMLHAPKTYAIIM
jgi:hypothetical protein